MIFHNVVSVGERLNLNYPKNDGTACAKFRNHSITASWVFVSTCHLFRHK